VPAAAVIPAPAVYTNAAAVKKLVVRFRMGRQACGQRRVSVVFRNHCGGFSVVAAWYRLIRP